MPQQIDVPGMGIVEFPDGMDDNAIAAAIKSNMPAPEKPFLEKFGNFVSKVRENPPPLAKTVAGAVTLPGDVYAGRTDPLSEEGIGRAADLAGIVSPMAPRGTGGIFARPTAPAGTPILPPPPAPRPSAVDPALEAAGRLGVDIPRYMATESTAIPQLAAGIKNVPMAGQPIVSSAERLTEQLAAAKRGLGAGTAETAGERAKAGLTSFIKTRSQEPVSQAYRDVDAYINPTLRVPLDNTRTVVGEIMAERTAARIPGRSKAVETVFDAVQDPAGMDYKGTKGLRSFLGEKSPQELAVSGLAPTEVKRLYGALTKDLSAVVRESSPEAFGKWQEANALARLTNMQRTALSKVTGAAGDAAPEAVFNRLVSYAQSKGGADLTRLRLAKRAMGPNAWSEVGSALIHRLGQAPDGQFSAQRFVTAFGNMAPAARNELFSGRQHAALQDLFTVSQYVKDRIGRFENVSGTSRGMFGGGMLTGALADPISIIGGMVGTRLLAEALAQPAVVRAATAVTRAQVRRNPVATRRALQQLYNIALRAGLVSAAQQRQQIEGRAEGGPVEEDRPYLVGEQGPETFVPDDPWARAAARTGRRGRAEGAGTRFVEGGYGIPAVVGSLDEGARRAFEEGGKIQHYGNEYYDPAPVVQQAIGATVAPLAGPAQAGAALGAGAIRRPELWHGVSKVRLPRPVAEMTSTHTPTAQLAEQVITPESLQGGVLLPAWGDRSRAGSVLTAVGERNLRNPVEMQGGHGFMAANADTGAAWASGKPVVGRLANQTRQLAESGKPVYFPYTAMGERSVDFSHHVSDTLAEMVKAKPLSREAATKFDDMMRAKDANFPELPGWPGLRSPNLAKWLAKASGDARNKFAKKMDTAEAQALGLPSVAEARTAVTDPRLLDVPTGAAGQSIARLDPEGRVISAPTNPHRSYDTQLGGRYVGGLEQPVPKEVMYPQMLDAYRQMGYDPFRYDYLMQRGVRGAPIAQQADQQWVDSVSQYLEAKRRQGQ